MPTFKITGPDGQTYRVTGENPEGALQALQQHLGGSARGAEPEPQQAAPQTRQPPQFDGGMAGAAALGAGDVMSFGFGDELGAGLGATSEYLASMITGEKPRSYDELLKAMRNQESRAKETNPGSFLAGQLAGGIAGGTGLAKAGLSATANAINAGKGLAGISKASAIEGAILGGVQGFGSGEGVEGRVSNSTIGAGLGFGLGGALPSVTTAVTGALKGATAPIIAPFRPDAYTDKAMRTYLQRSGKTPDEIADVMRLAADEGQPMYTIADAMGNAGQRAMVPVTRTPNDARQEVTDFLVRRQMGQPERLASSLADAFDAPMTSDSVTRALKDARGTEADALYGAARRNAGAVNVTPILQRIDETLAPGVNQMMNPRDNIGYDTIEGALARVRRMISDGNSQVTDYNGLFRVKLDLDDAITKAEGQGAGNRAHALTQVKREVDRALEAGSSDFRRANDTFARRSQIIDSVAEGQAAKSGRVRAEDSIEQFGRLTPEQQQAFRSGYVDPIISDIESKAMGPSTNRARTLTTPKYEQEFQAFAAPGRGDRLGRQIGRENHMFETNNAALGNSRTADNLGDIDDMANFDPAVLSNLLQGNFPQAALSGVRQAFSAGKGLPPRVVERVGRQLIETDPDEALKTLTRVHGQQMSRDQLRALILSSMLQGTGAGTGRIASP